MKHNDLFSALNIKIWPQALEPTICEEILMEINSKMETNEILLKELDTRKTYKHELSQQLFDKIFQKLNTEIRPHLEEFFDMPLTYSQPLQALVYTDGHFFKPHRDDTESVDRKYRKLTTVIFLNQQGKSEGQGDYGGGDLNLVGLFEKHPSKGFPVPNTQGSMVAFRSDVIHEVTPVLWGNRGTLVMWFT